ncbi:ERAP1-like C-terminal domain-containing protein [Mycena sanguinolenta]|nr:ERAP1-like C-terminal domain-containing protein [Mycena sanguinolenta]
MGGQASFVTGHVQRAMMLDAKRSSHPIEVECPDANFISQIFDGLAYSKASAVLRMLSEYIGEEQFLKGVFLYLKAHLYGNSVTRDLWDGISASSGQNRLLDAFFRSVSLITITETSNGIHVRQDRYLDNGTPNAEENETIWFEIHVNVPLAILTVTENGQVHVDKTALLEEREKTFAIDTSRTFKLNSGTTGLYRVLYTPERLSKIATEAAKRDSAFSLGDRIGLLRDVSELSQAGLTSVSSLLNLVDIWHLVWVSILNSLEGITRSFEDHSRINTGLCAFIRTLFAPLVQRLGYDFPDGEPVAIVRLRKTAVLGAVEGRDESVTRELLGRFQHYMKTGDTAGMPPDIKMPIFTTAARYGGREEFEGLLKIIESPVNPADRGAAIRAIGCTEDLGLIKELFSYILTKARDQDVMTFFWGLEANSIARPLLVPFFQNNYDAACFRSLSTREAHDDAQAFFADKDTTRYSMALARALETIRARIAYTERSENDLCDWLTKWQQQSKS